MTAPDRSQDGQRNPFRPGMGLDPPYLADRQAHLDRFKRYPGGLAGITIRLRAAERGHDPAPIEDPCFAALRSCCAAVAPARRRGLVVLYDEAHVIRDSSRSHRYPSAPCWQRSRDLSASPSSADSRL